MSLRLVLFILLAALGCAALVAVPAWAAVDPVPSNPHVGAGFRGAP
jgi:hypothetical protein